MKRRLWYKNWTETYIEGLPVGNGRIAAMMLGRPENLRIALNHEWLWRGENRYRECQIVSDKLKEVRENLLKEDFLKGTELANVYFGGNGGISGIPKRIDPFQPAGDLWLNCDAGNVTDYIRSLDLDTGLAQVEYTSDHGKISQKLLVSCADDILITEMKAEKPVDAEVVLDRIADSRCTITYDKNMEGLHLKGILGQEISFEISVKIVTDGNCITDGRCMKIREASRIFLLLQIGTNAKGNDPGMEMVFPESRSFSELFQKHVNRFHILKGKAGLEIDIEEPDLPTDMRISLFRQGQDPALPILYFEYGRYLMVCGSSGELPLNLQGKWNEDLDPAWQSDYHLNINLEMCYWFVETLGMGHASDTLFSFLERNVPYGRIMAQRLYGCRGFTLALAGDVWGRITPESCGWAVWTGTAPWLGQHMFMHWRYTKNMDFLRERCYPYLKEAAAFYEDYLIAKNGELWIVPSQSPENRFEGTGKWPVSIGVNSAVDVELILDLMNAAAECADILGVDADRRCHWRKIAESLPKLSQDSMGRLNEWDKERQEVEPGHRHFSHLYGLYPSQLFEPGSREWKAAEKSLDFRLSYGGGHTGWSRSWTACIMARLGRREDAWHHLEELIKEFSTISLLDLHPPRVFQIDGNMGGTACVCEMLMQSRRGRLILLPALPKAWKKGKITNFCAQDGITVSFKWENEKLTVCELISQEDQTISVISGDNEWKVDLEAGKCTTIYA